MIISKMQQANNLSDRQWTVRVALISALLLSILMFLQAQGLITTPWVFKEKLNMLGAREVTDPVWTVLKAVFDFVPVIAVALYVGLEAVSKRYEAHKKAAIKLGYDTGKLTPEVYWKKILPLPFSIKWGKRLLGLLLLVVLFGGSKIPFSQNFVNLVDGKEFEEDMVDPKFVMAKVYDAYLIKDLSKTMSVIRANLNDDGYIPSTRSSEWKPIGEVLEKTDVLSAVIQDNQVIVQGLDQVPEGYEAMVVFTRMVFDEQNGVHAMNARTFKRLSKGLTTSGEFVLDNLKEDVANTASSAFYGPGDVTPTNDRGRARWAAQHLIDIL